MSKKNNKNKKNTFISGIVSLLLIITCSCLFGSFFSSAHSEYSLEDSPKIKYYKSIEIEQGDSLWKIAKENMPDEYDSIYEYLEELLTINNLDIISADSIQAGNYLTIVYYK